MDASLLPLVKLLLGFGLVIGWGVFEIMKTRRSMRR